VREVTNQFLSNARLYSSVLSDRLKCSSVLEEVTEVGSPFQMVGAAWLKAVRLDPVMLVIEKGRLRWFGRVER